MRCNCDAAISNNVLLASGTVATSSDQIYDGRTERDGRVDQASDAQRRCIPTSLVVSVTGALSFVISRRTPFSNLDHTSL